MKMKSVDTIMSMTLSIKNQALFKQKLFWTYIKKKKKTLFFELEMGQDRMPVTVKYVCRSATHLRQRRFWKVAHR